MSAVDGLSLSDIYGFSLEDGRDRDTISSVDQFPVDRAPQSLAQQHEDRSIYGLGAPVV